MPPTGVGMSGRGSMRYGINVLSHTSTLNLLIIAMIPNFVCSFANLKPNTDQQYYLLLMRSLGNITYTVWVIFTYAIVWSISKRQIIHRMQSFFILSVKSLWVKTFGICVNSWISVNRPNWNEYFCTLGYCYFGTSKSVVV